MPEAGTGAPQGMPRDHGRRAGHVPGRFGEGGRGDRTRTGDEAPREAARGRAHPPCRVPRAHRAIGVITVTFVPSLQLRLRNDGTVFLLLARFKPYPVLRQRLPGAGAPPNGFRPRLAGCPAARGGGSLRCRGRRPVGAAETESAAGLAAPVSRSRTSFPFLIRAQSDASLALVTWAGRESARIPGDARSRKGEMS